ncbi:TolC family outer membrane protein [Pantoea agglomerans]|uniref:TolC family outer membrane protein n=1 Tax=Enterobacter agglomerans TaxID=549 RepID=UPI003C7C5C63
METSIFPGAKISAVFVILFCAFNGNCADNTTWPVKFCDNSPRQKKTPEVPAHHDVFTSDTSHHSSSLTQEKASTIRDNVIFSSSADVLQRITPTLQPETPTSTPPSSGVLVSLREAVKSAVEWHPTIKRAERELAQSKEYINEAKSSYYPSVNAQVKSGIEESEYAGGNDRSDALVLSATQVLYDFGKTQSKVKLASSSAGRQGSGLDKSISDVIYETANSYLQTVRYLRLVDVARNQVSGFRDINEIARKRATLGASAQSDYSQSKVRLASSVAQLHDYEAQAERWASVLDHMTNKHISPRLIPRFPEDLKNVCQNVDSREVTSPSMAMAYAQIEMAKDQIASSKAEYFPTISLNPSYEYQLDNNNDGGYRTGMKKGRWGVFLNVSVPLYEGGQQLSRTRQSEQALYAAQYNLDQEKTEARRRIAESTSQIASMEESLQAKIVREKEAQQTRDLYKLQYIELGNRSFSDLLTAEAEIHQTRMDIMNSRFTMASLAVDCLNYSGQLPDYVARPGK